MIKKTVALLKFIKCALIKIALKKIIQAEFLSSKSFHHLRQSISNKCCSLATAMPFAGKR